MSDVKNKQGLDPILVEKRKGYLKNSLRLSPKREKVTYISRLFVFFQS